MTTVAVSLEDLILDAQVPRCPRTRRSLAEHEGEAIRHGDRVLNRIMTKTAKKRMHHGKMKLSDAQNRALFSDGANPDDFKSFRLDKRQRAQLKLLRKLRRQATRDVELQAT